MDKKIKGWKNIAIHLPEYLINGLEELVKIKNSNKSKFIQELIREACIQHCKNPKVKAHLKIFKLKEIITSSKDLQSIEKELMLEIKRFT